MVQHTCQFDGLPRDDPNKHISSFLEICDTQRINSVSMEVIKLKLFPFSLKDKAKTWFNLLPKNTIATWDEMEAIKNDILILHENEDMTLNIAKWKKMIHVLT